MQQGQPVEYATKALTATQVSYAQIEKELLAVLFGCRKFHYYVYECRSLTVETDHKPLVSLIQKGVDNIRSATHLLDYAITLVYKQGKEMVIADTLSRANYDVDIDHGDSAFDPMAVCKSKSFPNSIVLKKFHQATEGEHELQILY